MNTIPETHQASQRLAGESLPASYAEPIATDFLQIRDYVRILYGWRWLIAAIMAAGLAGGLVVNWRAPRVFEARATIQIETDPNVMALDRPVVDQRDWMREFLPTQLGILASRDLARMAHEELTRNQNSLPPRERPEYTPTAAEILQQRRIDPVKDTRLVTVGFQSTDPVVAAAVANALARAYVQRTLEFRSRTTGEASDWLSQQVKAQRKVVEESEAALQRYRKEHGADALFTDRLGAEPQNIVVQKLAELQGAASRARADTIEKQAQFQQLLSIQAAHQPLDTLPAISSNAYIQGLKSELTTLERQLSQASSELGERHPDILKLQGAIANAHSKLDTETANVVSAIRNDFEAAQAREAAVAAALSRQRGEVQALNGKSVEYTALEREATSNRDVLDKLLQRSTETKIARELQSTNVAIVDAAEIPTWPILPRKDRTVLVALVGSGALALALVFVLEISNTRLTSPQDVERHLHVRVLGLSPQVKPENGRVPLLLSDGVPAQFAELLHGLRTNLLLAPELSSVRTLLVTSSEPGEGKTVTAANLAVSLSRLKQRVLLIDADLRRPRLHEVFGTAQEPGLTDALAGGTTSVEALRSTKVPGLWLLSSGKPSRNPADLLGSERFAKLVDLLQAHFDWLVLDSPPVMAVTDPCLIARVTSGVLFVVGSGQTSPAVASAAVQRLTNASDNVLGVMLNRAVLGQPGASYLPYYHRDYETYYARQQPNGPLDVPEILAEESPARRVAPSVVRG